MLIGFWILDELSFNKCHQHYDSIAQVMQNQSFSGNIHSDKAIPIPLANVLRKEYGNDFKQVILSSGPINTNYHLMAKIY